jgi:hypothetical protein
VSAASRVRHADALDPVDLLTAGGAVEDQLPEFSLQIGSDLQEFQPDLLRRNGDGVIRG